jgi:hypothetical protein
MKKKINPHIDVTKPENLRHTNTVKTKKNGKVAMDKKKIRYLQPDITGVSSNRKSQ